MVDTVAHPGFGAGGQRLSRGEPPHTAVFIGLYTQRLGIIGFDEIGAIEMQVGRDIPPSFFVSIHGKDLDREQFTTDGAERLQSGFLGYLPQCDRQKVGLSIGMAASMGAFLLSSGTKGKRLALPNAEIMIHQPSAGTQGQITDMAIHLKRLEVVKKRMNRILAENTGRPVEEVTAACERDNFMTAEEAKAFGLIDRVLDHH